MMGVPQRSILGQQLFMCIYIKKLVVRLMTQVSPKTSKNGHSLSYMSIYTEINIFMMNNSHRYSHLIQIYTFLIQETKRTLYKQDGILSVTQKGVHYNGIIMFNKFPDIIKQFKIQIQLRTNNFLY